MSRERVCVCVLMCGVSGGMVLCRRRRLKPDIFSSVLTGLDRPIGIPATSRARYVCTSVACSESALFVLRPPQEDGCQRHYLASTRQGSRYLLKRRTPTCISIYLFAPEDQHREARPVSLSLSLISKSSDRPDHRRPGRRGRGGCVLPTRKRTSARITTAVGLRPCMRGYDMISA